MIDVKEFQRREREAKQRVIKQIEELKESAFVFTVFAIGFLMGVWLV